MARLLPPPTGPISRQVVTLDGSTFLLVSRWNDRASAWLLDVYLEDETPIATGLAVRAGQEVGAYIRTLPLGWPGLMVCVDTSEQGLDPAYEDLGERVQLVYVESAAVGGL